MTNMYACTCANPKIHICTYLEFSCDLNVWFALFQLLPLPPQAPQKQILLRRVSFIHVTTYSIYNFYSLLISFVQSHIILLRLMSQCHANAHVKNSSQNYYLVKNTHVIWGWNRMQIFMWPIQETLKYLCIVGCKISRNKSHDYLHGQQTRFYQHVYLYGTEFTHMMSGIFNICIDKYMFLFQDLPVSRLKNLTIQTLLWTYKYQ